MPDVAVIGGGALGLYMVKRLSDRGMHPLLIEPPQNSLLSLRRAVRDATGGSKHVGVYEGWLPGLGGTTQIWGGQLWPWELSDFEVPVGSTALRWPPAAISDVMANYMHVLRQLGLSTAHEEAHSGLLSRAQLNGALREGRVRHSTWMSRRQRQFAVNEHLSRGRDRVSLCHLRVSSVEPTGRGWLIRGVDSHGSPAQVAVPQMVLAAGTLWNFGIAAQSPALAGADLGHGFMDHVSTPVAQFAVENLRRFLRTSSPILHRTVLASPRLIPPERTSSVGVPGYGHWEVQSPEWLPLTEAKQLLATRKAAEARRVARGLQGHVLETGASVLTATMTRRRPVFPGASVVLRVDVEQRPSPMNRLEFDAQAGQVVVNWSIGSAERAATRRIASSLLGDLDMEAAGLRFERLLDEEPRDIFHMMGGLPLGGTVVNASGALRAGRGGYVVGPATFPSGGLANPTLTALALAEATSERIANA